MYFQDRSSAGHLLSSKLTQYRYENSIVVALSDGGVVVGEQIASQLHCALTMLLTEEVVLPGEHNPIGSIGESGGFVYNDMFSIGQIEYFTQEYQNYIEQSKLKAMHEINKMLGGETMLDKDMLRDRVVILASDGLISGMSLVVAADYMKSVRTQKVVVATPIATIASVDKMHVMADEVVCLSVVDGVFGIDHYYENNDRLDHDAIIKALNEIILKWQ